MNETHTTTQSVTTKVLAIVGFVATIALIIFLLVEGVSRAPSTFSSLASVAKSIDTYRPITELEITLKKTVVNSKESFEIHWTDTKQKGEYVFGYTCVSGVELLVRRADGKLQPMKCSDSLSLPETVHGLFLSVASDAMRFTDVPLTLVFKNTDGKELYTGSAKVTVVNAQIPVGGNSVTEDEVKEETPSTPEPKPVEPKPTEPTNPAPSTPTAPSKPTAPTPVVTTVVFPTSNPHGSTDLKVTMLGSGIIERGAFMFTPTYDRDFSNAIRFTIKNVGGKTSDSWTFRTKLPDGQNYESKSQAPLKPQEYVEFTIGFSISGSDDLVDITTSVSTDNDVNSKNNKATWSVVVQD